MPTSLFTVSGRPRAGLPISCRGVGLVSFWRRGQMNRPRFLGCPYSIRGIVAAAKRRTILSQERSVNSDICLRRGILLFVLDIRFSTGSSREGDQIRRRLLQPLVSRTFSHSSQLLHNFKRRGYAIYRFKAIREIMYLAPQDALRAPLPVRASPIGTESYRVGCERILKSPSEHWHIPVFQSLDSRSKVLPVRLRK